MSTICAPAKRGQFLIGPVTAEFSDPFGLSLHRHAIDDGDLLTVTPAAVELPETGLAGARGHDGVTATRVRANPERRRRHDPRIPSRGSDAPRALGRDRPARVPHGAAGGIRHDPGGDHHPGPAALGLPPRRVSPATVPTFAPPRGHPGARGGGRPRPADLRRLRVGCHGGDVDRRAPRRTQLLAAVPGQPRASPPSGIRRPLPSRRPRSTPERPGCSPSPKAWPRSSFPARTTPTTAPRRTRPGHAGSAREAAAGPATPRRADSAPGPRAPGMPRSLRRPPDGQTFRPPAAGTGPGGPGQPDPGRGPGAVPGRRVRRERLRAAGHGPGQDSGEVARGAGGAAAGRMAGRGGIRPSSLPDAWAAFDQADPAMSAAADVRRGVGGPAMTLATATQPGAHSGHPARPATEEPTVLSPGAASRPDGPGAQPWVMATAVAVAVAGAALGFNGVLRGWAWYSPVFTHRPLRCVLHGRCSGRSAWPGPGS